MRYEIRDISESNTIRKSITVYIWESISADITYSLGMREIMNPRSPSTRIMGFIEIYTSTASNAATLDSNHLFAPVALHPSPTESRGTVQVSTEELGAVFVKYNFTFTVRGEGIEEGSRMVLKFPEGYPEMGGVDYLCESEQLGEGLECVGVTRYHILIRENVITLSSTRRAVDAGGTVHLDMGGYISNPLALNLSDAHPPPILIYIYKGQSGCVGEVVRVPQVGFTYPSMQAEIYSIPQLSATIPPTLLPGDALLTLRIKISLVCSPSLSYITLTVPSTAQLVAGTAYLSNNPLLLTPQVKYGELLIGGFTCTPGVLYVSIDVQFNDSTATQNIIIQSYTTPTSQMKVGECILQIDTLEKASGLNYYLYPTSMTFLGEPYAFISSFSAASDLIIQAKAGNSLNIDFGFIAITKAGTAGLFDGAITGGDVSITFGTGDVGLLWVKIAITAPPLHAYVPLTVYHSLFAYPASDIYPSAHDILANSIYIFTLSPLLASPFCNYIPYIYIYIVSSSSTDYRVITIDYQNRNLGGNRVFEESLGLPGNITLPYNLACRSIRVINVDPNSLKDIKCEITERDIIGTDGIYTRIIISGIYSLDSSGDPVEIHIGGIENPGSAGANCRVRVRVGIGGQEGFIYYHLFEKDLVFQTGQLSSNEEYAGEITLIGGVVSHTADLTVQFAPIQPLPRGGMIIITLPHTDNTQLLNEYTSLWTDTTKTQYALRCVLGISALQFCYALPQIS